jgi:hypothetical protein
MRVQGGQICITTTIMTDGLLTTTNNGGLGTQSYTNARIAVREAELQIPQLISTGGARINAALALADLDNQITAIRANPNLTDAAKNYQYDTIAAGASSLLTSSNTIQPFEFEYI